MQCAIRQIQHNYKWVVPSSCIRSAQDELRVLCKAQDIDTYFDGIFGSPTHKNTLCSDYQGAHDSMHGASLAIPSMTSMPRKATSLYRCPESLKQRPVLSRGLGIMAEIVNSAHILPLLITSILQAIVMLQKLHLRFRLVKDMLVDAYRCLIPIGLNTNPSIPNTGQPSSE